MFFKVLQNHHERVIQLLAATCRACFSFLVQGIHADLELLQTDLRKQAELVAEVGEERAFGDIGLLRDAFCADRVEVALIEQVRGGHQNALAGFLCSFLFALKHGSLKFDKVTMVKK